LLKGLISPEKISREQTPKNALLPKKAVAKIQESKKPKSKESTMGSRNRLKTVESNEEEDEESYENKFNIEKLMDNSKEGLQKPRSRTEHQKPSRVANQPYKESQFSKKIPNQGVKQNGPRNFSQSGRGTRRTNSTEDVRMRSFIPSAWNPIKYGGFIGGGVNHPGHRSSTVTGASFAGLAQTVFLNLMVVGERGLGKTTFIRMFSRDKMGLGIKEFLAARGPTASIHELIGEFQPNKIEKDDRLKAIKTVKIMLVDTPGWDKGKSMKEVYDDVKAYVKGKNEAYKRIVSELGGSPVITIGNNAQLPGDPRIHACIYMFSGKRLKTNDVICMNKLQKYVNIIPVMANVFEWL
jgi:Septin